MPITINADFRQFPDIGEVRDDVVWAANTWQTVLRNITQNAGNRTLKMRAVGSHTDLRSSGFSAMCVPNAVNNFPHAIAQLWYPSALADQIEDQDLQPWSPDMTLFLDLDHFRWNIGNGAPHQNELDLRSIVLHEIGHGLGFVSLFVEAGGQGSLNGNNLKSLIPGELLDLLGFDLPDFGDDGTVFDSYLLDHTGNALNAIDNPVTLGATLTDTEHAINFQDGNVTERVWVTSTFQPFTSIMHLYDNASASLMRHSIGPGERVTSIDAAVQRVLGRLGWR